MGITKRFSIQKQKKLIMASQLQSTTLAPPKFLCLEDRLLRALYKQTGRVSLESLAHPISITATAALSIAHRINKTYPAYIQLEEQSSIEDCYISPVETEAPMVQAFLHTGGFTKINEQEFIQYYEKEFKKENRKAMLQLYKIKIKREKWAIGITTLVGLGIILATYLYKKKQVNP